MAYIERESLLKIPDSEWEAEGRDEIIRRQPAANVVARAVGKWIEWEHGVFCSHCFNSDRVHQDM